VKALIYHGPGELSVEDREIPKPGPGEVLIKVRAVSVCGSDLGAYKLPEASDRWKPPIVLGHEFAGDIAAVGENVKSLKIGQRVAANPILYCGECYYCERGLINLCARRHSLGTSIGGEAEDGAMQEYFVLREEAVIALDDRVSYTQGALLEPLAVCYCAAKRGMSPGETAAVIGAGPIGLMIIKFLKAQGVKSVFASDISDVRLGFAQRYGAVGINVKNESLDAKIMEMTDGIGVDRIIIAADTPTAFEDSFKIIRNGGDIVLVALMHRNTTLDPMQLVGRGVSLIGSYMFTTEQREVMRMIAEGEIFIDDLVTSEYSLEDGPEVFKKLCSDGCRDVKVMMNM